METRLGNLEKVLRKLTLQTTNGELSQKETRSMVIAAQNELGLLETALRNNPHLIHAQVGLLEAMILNDSLKLEEAALTARYSLRCFLESIEKNATLSRHDKHVIP